jgi:uncharacterized protein YqeY
MLEDKIMSDFKEAMKNKEAVRTSTLSLLRSQFKYVLIEKKADKLADADVIAVIKKQAKQRQDAIEQYEKGGRPELAEKEKQELAILKSYLPAEMDEAQLTALVAEAISEVKAASIKDMGKVMPVVMAKVAGRADSKMISDTVKQALTTL